MGGDAARKDGLRGLRAMARGPGASPGGGVGGAPGGRREAGAAIGPARPCWSARGEARLAAMLGARGDGAATSDAALAAHPGTGASPGVGTGDGAVALAGSRPARRVLRWLGPGVRLTAERERGWASAAFVGVRHRLELTPLAGLTDADRAALAARLALLDEAELDLPDAFVAEARRVMPDAPDDAPEGLGAGATAAGLAATDGPIVLELLVIEAR